MPDTETYKSFMEKPDERLFEYVTERESSPLRHMAEHILQMRRNEQVRLAAQQSASAARWATVAAFISALAAIIALFRH